MHWLKISILVVTGVLVFASMILAAMASSDAGKSEMDKAKKNGMYAAVLSGVSLVGIVIALILCFWGMQKEGMGLKGMY